MAVAILSGCTTSPGGSSNSATSFDQPSARSLLADGRSAVARGNLVLGIAPLQELTARYPESSEAIEGHYLLGTAYHSLGDFRAALQAFQQYQIAAPEGEHAEEVASLVEGLTSDLEERYPSQEELAVQIASLREEWSADEAPTETGAALAERLWMAGRYEESAEVYRALVLRDPEFAREPVFSQRVEVRADGSHTLLTPEEIKRREVEQNPVIVMNMSSYRSGRDRRTQVQRHFMVTGQAANRSGEVLQNVELDVTLYGFGNLIYDTKTQRLGEMRPGVTRAFSVRFSNFREINSIDRYDYQVRYRR